MAKQSKTNQTSQTTIDQEKLARRADARKLAKGLIDLVLQSMVFYNEDQKEAFWDEIGPWIDQNRPVLAWEQVVKESKEPMTDREARTFGEMQFWFGKYKGDYCANQLLYLDYMVGKDKHFMDGQARRYLQNDKIAEQLKILIEARDHD